MQKNYIYICNKSKLYAIFIFIFLVNYFNFIYIRIKKRIGIIGLEHSQNIGNNLLKFALSIKLSELGYSPYIVGKKFAGQNISFLTNAVNVRLINNFSEIKESDYDILMVNSDQTWRKWNKDFYDIAFLKFAENWNIKKFVYGASLGTETWRFDKTDEKIAKILLKNFTGLSVREKDSIQLIEKNLGLKAQFVLDPTLLINKKYYLNIIKNYKSEIIKDIYNEKFIFSYAITLPKQLEKFFDYVKTLLNIKIYYITLLNQNLIHEFLLGIINCKAVITDSFHATIFSIIFKKPFVTIINNFNDHSRFNSLDKIFNIKNRIFDLNTTPPISLLKEPLIINETKLRILKKESIDYLKKNLLAK